MKRNFRAWLLSQMKRDDATGDIARLAAAAETWPSTGDLFKLERHLFCLRPHPFGMASNLKQAFSEFESLREGAMNPNGPNLLEYALSKAHCLAPRQYPSVCACAACVFEFGTREEAARKGRAAFQSWLERSLITVKRP